MENQNDLEPAPSKAAIAGHPIHVMLIPFPVALLTLLPVSDILYATTGSLFWAWASYYLLWGGILSAGLAAIFGLIDFIGVPRVRSVLSGWAHMLLNVGITGLSIVNLVLRRGGMVEDAILPIGLVLSLIGASMLLVSAWFGGELIYRHRVGISKH